MEEKKSLLSTWQKPVITVVASAILMGLMSFFGTFIYNKVASIDELRSDIENTRSMTEDTQNKMELMNMKLGQIDAKLNVLQQETAYIKGRIRISE